jgi:ABC-type branched-subunit amino acid transport system substrate-binding protein
MTSRRSLSSRRSPRAIAVVAVLALGAAACGGSSGSSSNGSSKGGASAPGITATSVLLGSHQPLTGPAAPGYSEIAPAAQAFFDYANAAGGVNGRKVTLKYLDDTYNPTTTVTVVKQLVLQDKVFGIMGGLGTPTHTKVVDYLNTNRVPDLFVASGCVCWDEPTKHPYTFGWQPDYLVEGKILGEYVKKTYPGKKIAFFGQGDDFGADGLKGLKMTLGSDVVTAQTYQPGNTNIAPQLTAIAGAKPDVVVLFTIPAYTALFKLGALKAGFNPKLVVTNVGSDAVTLSGLLEAFAKQGGATVNGNQLIDGIVTDSYLPALGDTSNSWTALFKKVHDQYLPKLPFDGNVVYGMAEAYTFLQALQKAGKNPTRQGVIDALESGGLQGPGLVPFRYSKDSHAGYTGVQIGTITSGAFTPSGTPFTTDDSSGAVTAATASTATAPANGVPTG